MRDIIRDLLLFLTGQQSHPTANGFVMQERRTIFPRHNNST